MVSHKVLIAGISGQVGINVAKYLLTKSNVCVIGALRNRQAVKKEVDDKLKKFESNPNYQTKEADVTKPDTLKGLLNGVTSVVSTLQGGYDVIIKGQKNLLDEAVNSGTVERFIASDFSVDMFQIEKNEHVWLKFRIQFAEEAAKQSKVKIIHPFNGAFAEVFFGFLGVLDKENKMFNYYGDKNQKLDITTIPDSAKFVAEASIDIDAPERLYVSGNELTIEEVKDIYNEVYGTDFKLNRKGDISDLKKKIREEVEKNPNPNDAYKYAPYMYQLPMLDGRGKLKNLHNSRYPSVKTTNIKDYLKQQKKID